MAWREQEYLGFHQNSEKKGFPNLFSEMDTNVPDHF